MTEPDRPAKVVTSPAGARLTPGPHAGWILAAIVLLSLAFRIHLARECSLWLDEIATRLAVSKPWSAIWAGPVRGHEPLMYALVKLVTGVCGKSTASLRCVSLVFGCFLLLSLYELCLELGLSKAHSLIVVATFALCPVFIRHATESRFYAILPTFTTLATTRAIRILREPRRFGDVPEFACSVVAAAATHYGGLPYAIALLATLGLGLSLGWRRMRLQWRGAVLGTLLLCLIPLAKIAKSAVAAGAAFGLGEADNDGAFGTPLLREIAREFAFLGSKPSWILVEPALALLGLGILSRRLRGAARLLPLGLGIVPCIAATFVSATHFFAPRYLAPSAVLYHLGACVAMFGLVQAAQQTLAPSAQRIKLVPYAAALLIIGSRALEFPCGFGAGGDDYGAFQRYFEAELAKDTALVAFPGAFGSLILGKEYRLSRKPIALERFRPDASVNRYLIVEIHCDTPERRAELESYVERNFGLSAQAWRSLPLVPIPHTRYQSGVVARLVGRPPRSKPHKAPSARARRRHPG